MKSSLKMKKITVAEAEAWTEIATKEEHNKEIEREKCENRINTIKINYNQELIDLNDRKKEIFMLKKGIRKSHVKDEAKKEDRRHESRKHRKKEWQEKSGKTEHSKNLDKWLADET